MRDIIALALWALLPAVLPNFPGQEVSEGQDVVVHLVDPSSGRPVDRVRVRLTLGDPRAPHTPQLEGRTGRDGAVVFHLKPPLPALLFVNDEVESVASCSHVLFQTAQVISAGVVADDVCHHKRKPKGSYTPKPGEIIVFAQKLRWWEKFQD